VSTARLDVELVRRGLARARGQAEEMVRAGRVSVDGRPASKPSLRVSITATIDVEAGCDPDWVGRGARKLDSLLEDLGGHDRRAQEPEDRTQRESNQAAPEAGPQINGRRCLDAGASTGGFTQVLLDRGAREVVAVDVGQEQLADVLRDDPRVRDLPGTTVRGLDPETVGGPVDLLVADLSFISLQVVLPDLVRLVRPGGDLLLLVKPQFEVGRRRLGSGGVVRDTGLRAEAVEAVASAALGLGLVVRAVRASRWPGPSGNVEYFLWLTLPSEVSDQNGNVEPLDRTAAVRPEALAAVVRAAVEEGPA
jgi:23S rRNA (cytidine1920-2'-O)/16S rRNA (cytidine1409-2'-O)-methyltransferase